MNRLLVVVHRCLLKINASFHPRHYRQYLSSWPTASLSRAGSSAKLLLAPRPFVLVFPFRCSLAYDGAHELLPLQTEPRCLLLDDFLRDQETIWDGVTNQLREVSARDEGRTKWIFYHTAMRRTRRGTGTVVNGMQPITHPSETQRQAEGLR